MNVHMDINRVLTADSGSTESATNYQPPGYSAILPSSSSVWSTVKYLFIVFPDIICPSISLNVLFYSKSASVCSY